jgi:hypothetical protein
MHKTMFARCIGAALLALLAACGGGGDSGGGVSAPAVLAAASAGAPVADCANGGITVSSGVDTNGNGVLDASEISSAQYVCNGAPGADGSSGSSGANALVRMSDAGGSCPNGGKMIEAGLDGNGNGVLDAAEVSSTGYACNGAAGAAGPAGPVGPAGAPGATGAPGASSLMLITPLAAGSDCPHGGVTIDSGVDGNGNGQLDAAEVTSTEYACNGAPAGLPWVDVTGTSVTAQSNTGYLAHNDAAQVVVTLPATPSVGDIVRVNGLGAGGWRIAQNDGQTIVGQKLWILGWAPRESNRLWRSVASSADGTKLVAVVLGGQIYTSTNSGVTWAARDQNRNWASVASSADGTKLVAVVNGGQIYTSTNSGATWAAQDQNRNWVSVASSADGTRLVAVVFGGQIYTSTNSGATWAAQDQNRNWVSVASSADGTRLVAVAGGQIYTSYSGGIDGTWVARGTTQNWSSVASSADGTKLVAVALAGQIYTSFNGGAGWTARDSVRHWKSVASSADGTKLVAVALDGIYTSADSGSNWVPWAVSNAYEQWTSVASSTDGTKLVAVAWNGQIYTSTKVTQDVQTAIGTSGGITGERYEAIELQYVGGGRFNVLSASGVFRVQ